MKRYTTKKKMFSTIAVLMAIILTFSVTQYFNTETRAGSTGNAAKYELQDNTQDGVILHAWNWSYNNIKSNLS